MTTTGPIPPYDPNQNPPPVTPPPGAPVSYGAGMSEKDARLWGMLCHLSALAMFIIPFGGVLGPLVVWLIKKQDSEFVDDQGKESLNFQITMVMIHVVCVILLFVVIGLILLPIAVLLDLIFIIIAAVKANGGERYRYPFAIRLIK